MPSRSSSIQPLVPHQSDHNPALSEPENYPSMLHGHFDMKKNSFLSKSMISTGLPEPELSGVTFSWNVLKLDWVVKAWGELAGMYTAAPHPNLLCYKHKKYANFNLNKKQQQQTKSCLWVEGKRLYTLKPVGVMDMFTTVTAVVVSWCLQPTYVRWYSSNTWHLLCNSSIQL